jgi:phage regulator Rha-like protein
MSKVAVPLERIENKIYLIRGQKVMIDRDLAELYGVETKYLTRQVRRNIERFPEDFMFQLSKEEAEASRCQIGTLKRGQNIKYLPYAFTEHGILMLSSVLNSPRAIQVNITIMRAFVKLRELMMTHRDLAKRIDELERQYADHGEKIVMIFDAIRQLMTPSAEPKRRKIGFYKE